MTGSTSRSRNSQAEPWPDGCGSGVVLGGSEGTRRGRGSPADERASIEFSQEFFRIGARKGRAVRCGQEVAPPRKAANAVRRGQSEKAGDKLLAWGEGMTSCCTQAEARRGRRARPRGRENARRLRLPSSVPGSRGADRKPQVRRNPRHSGTVQGCGFPDAAAVGLRNATKYRSLHRYRTIRFRRRIRGAGKR